MTEVTTATNRTATAWTNRGFSEEAGRDFRHRAG